MQQKKQAASCFLIDPDTDDNASASKSQQQQQTCSPKPINIANLVEFLSLPQVLQYHHIINHLSQQLGRRRIRHMLNADLIERIETIAVTCFGGNLYLASLVHEMAVVSAAVEPAKSHVACMPKRMESYDTDLSGKRFTNMTPDMVHIPYPFLRNSLADDNKFKYPEISEWIALFDSAQDVEIDRGDVKSTWDRNGFALSSTKQVTAVVRHTSGVYLLCVWSVQFGTTQNRKLYIYSTIEELLSEHGDLNLGKPVKSHARYGLTPMQQFYNSIAFPTFGTWFQQLYGL